jgi:hypothetical protein
LNTIENTVEQRNDSVASTFLRDLSEDTVVLDRRQFCLQASSSSDYRTLKNLLIQSFKRQWQAKQVYWPNRFNKFQQDCFPLIKIHQRIHAEIFQCL